MKKLIRDYKGSAEHLYWLITGNPHPKNDFVYKWLKNSEEEPDLHKIAEDKEEQRQEQMSEEEYNDFKRVKEAEDFQSNK